MFSKNQKTFIGKLKAKIETIKIFKSNTKQIILGAVAAFLLFSGLFVLNDHPKDSVHSLDLQTLKLEERKTNGGEDVNNTEHVSTAKRFVEPKSLEDELACYVDSAGNDNTGDGSLE